MVGICTTASSSCGTSSDGSRSASSLLSACAAANNLRLSVFISLLTVSIVLCVRLIKQHACNKLSYFLTICNHVHVRYMSSSVRPYVVCNVRAPYSHCDMFGPPLTELRYTSGFVDGVLFPHNTAYSGITDDAYVSSSFQVAAPGRSLPSLTASC